LKIRVSVVQFHPWPPSKSFSSVQGPSRLPKRSYRETGLNQNVNRDYDPLVGKYVESDPIGLAAGSNTYLYASADPVMMWDQYGLMSDDDCCARSIALGQKDAPGRHGVGNLLRRPNRAVCI
jgi:RHS repeat-associated protein